MHPDSSNTKRFLYAAKLAELKTLKQLSENCHLVVVVCDLIHELQKERGVNNVYLASAGLHYSQRRLIQICDSKNMQQRLSDVLNKHYIETKQNGDNYRLLFSITLCLQSIDNLAALRESIALHNITPLASTQAYCHLIDNLISIIFEAADISSDTNVTRQLVALFNFIQGKEYTGQERAWGAIGFAESYFTQSICDNLLSMQQSQTASFDIFLEFTTHEHKQQWQQFTKHPTSAELTKFRKLILQLANGSPISPEISEAWYDVTTTRIDMMHVIESSLSSQLEALCLQKLNTSEAQVKSYHHDVNNCDQLTSSHDSSLTFLHQSNMMASIDVNAHSDESVQAIPSANHLHKPLYDLLCKQSKRIEEMSGELDLAKQSLLDAKLISRAKLLLMQEMNMTESQAHKKIQQAAMQQSVSLAEVATNIVKASKGLFKGNK